MKFIAIQLVLLSVAVICTSANQLCEIEASCEAVCFPFPHQCNGSDSPCLCTLDRSGSLLGVPVNAKILCTNGIPSVACTLVGVAVNTNPLGNPVSSTATCNSAGVCTCSINVA